MNPSTAPAVSELNADGLDALHDRLLALLRQTLELPQAALDQAYQGVVEQIETDFRQENLLMETFQCADAHLHREQHARMLAGLHQAGSALAGGDPAPAYRALAVLADWLPFHIATQDCHLSRLLRARDRQ
ncbi:MAG TPA: hemerythrin family protein, partial [Duganella sp.]|nr:hemerythrin family protein [Duganella sp.]